MRAAGSAAVHPDDRKRTETAWIRALSTRTSFEIEHRIRRADGEWRTMIGHAVPLFDEHGQIKEWIGAHTDVTAQRRVEAARRESEAKLALALETAKMGTWTWDVAADLITGPDHFGLLFHRPRSGDPVSFDEFVSAICPADRDRVVATMRTALIAGSPFQAEFQIGGPDDPECWVGIRAAVVRDGEDKAPHIAGIAMDITARRQAESERRRREEEERVLESKMQQAQKLESLGVMAGGIAHDFNNLLVGILGNAGLALMDLPAASPLRDSLTAIEVAARRAAELVGQMLAYSGRGPFRLTALNLPRLVQEMGELLGSVIPKNVEIHYDFSTPVAAVRGDPTQISQIAMNLITNAAEALGKTGGVIEVSVGMVDQAGAPGDALGLGSDVPRARTRISRSPIRVAAWMSPPRPECSSPSLPPNSPVAASALPRYRALCARIGVRSEFAVCRGREPPSASTFRRTRPRSCRPATSRPPLACRCHDRARGTVLVADDEAIVRSTSKRLLERAGFKVLLARNGRDAIDLYDVHANEIVAILLDLTMPVLAGDAAFDELLRRQPCPQVILTSGFSEEETASRFAGKPLAGFLQKPYRAAELLAMLARIVEEG